MRKVLWNMLHEYNSIDYNRIIQEFLPLGSRFTERGGYFTPDDVCISRSLRTKVMTIKNEYMTERNDQEDRVRIRDAVLHPLTTIVYPYEAPTPLIPADYGETPVAMR
jgi:hypothetical protein